MALAAGLAAAAERALQAVAAVAARVAGVALHGPHVRDAQRLRRCGCRRRGAAAERPACFQQRCSCDKRGRCVRHIGASLHTGQYVRSVCFGWLDRLVLLTAKSAGFQCTTQKFSRLLGAE